MTGKLSGFLSQSFCTLQLRCNPYDVANIACKAAHASFGTCVITHLAPMQALDATPSLAGCQKHPVETGTLDLASLDSVRSFTSDFNARSLPLALLICNAGIMAPPKRLVTQDGFEQQFQVIFASIC